MGTVALVDNFIYHYSPLSNQLSTFSEGGSIDAGFEPLNANSSMGYDNRGNITSYGPQGLTISYNMLNLPKLIEGNQVIYDAEGNKWQQSGSETRMYVNGIERVDGNIEKFFHEDGAYNFQEERVEYQIKDHLGSVRVYFSDLDGDGTIAQSEVLQRTLYYPFGMIIDEHPEYYSGATEQNYKYNGKENYNDANLDWLDYGARWYDPNIGRFTSVDPLADQRSFLSPYNYVQNNPQSRIDPTGALDDPIHDNASGEFLGHYNDSDFDGEIMLMDREAYMNITKGEDVVISTSLAEDYGFYLSEIFSWKEMPEMSDLRLLSNVYTNLLKEASSQGLINFDPSRLKNEVIGISGADGFTYPAGYYYTSSIANTGPINSDGRFQVWANIQYYDKESNYKGPHLKYMTHAGNAISILGVHEYGQHGVAGLQGNHHHPKIYRLQWKQSKGYIGGAYKELLKKRAGL